MTHYHQESRVRRLARREGYQLRRSRIRNPDHPAHGMYAVVSPYINGVVFGCGSWGFDASLAECETWLTGDGADK